MYNFSAGKIKILPNEVKKVNLEKKFFNKNPKVILSSVFSNRNVYVKKVYRKFFLVVNNTQKSVLVNYTVSDGIFQKNKSEVRQDITITVNAPISTINVYPNTLDHKLDLNTFIIYSQDTTPNFNIDFNSSTYVLRSGQQSFDFNSIYTDLSNQDNLILHTSSLKKKISTLNLKVESYLVENPDIETSFFIPFNIIDYLYKTSIKSSINYNTNINIIKDNPVGRKFIYKAGNIFEDQKIFNLPQVNIQTYFSLDLRQSLEYASDLRIILAPFSAQDDIPIYYTTNPEDPVNNRTVAFSVPPLSNYNNFVEISNRSNVNSSKYYFWLSLPDNAWYISTERFPYNV